MPTWKGYRIPASENLTFKAAIAMLEDAMSLKETMPSADATPVVNVTLRHENVPYWNRFLIGSIGLVYLYHYMDGRLLWFSWRWIYQSHGSYGFMSCKYLLTLATPAAPNKKNPWRPFVAGDKWAVWKMSCGISWSHPHDSWVGMVCSPISWVCFFFRYVCW